jgi:alpha-glucosidase/alpha-D-xyloside xylohydrolase
MARSAALVVIAMVSGSFTAGGARSQDTVIRWGNAAAELSINEISPRTLQIVLAPLDQAGAPRRAPDSSALVEQQAQTRLATRALAAPKQIMAGRASIEVRPGPLTVTVKNSRGKVVQALVFDGAARRFTFQAPATVFGLGEGSQQFDRRGANYSMHDGWGAWDRPRLGSWVAVPLVIGTDGWALLVHHPQGEFDLRDEAAGFAAWPDQDSDPLVAYLIAWETPEEMLAEYGRLVGHAPMPPKWALGYMQSHRTLAGPEEVLEVARTFREKKLPCDALIYLGTGYCPAGWNTGHNSLEFNPATFDQPAEMLAALDDMHFRVVLHKNAPPRRLTGTKVERVEAPREDGESRRDGGRRRSSDISTYWARHRETFALGVDGWWPDDGDELSRESRIARHRMYYEGALLDRPDVRPWSLHRTGYAGVGRFGGWIWSGDIDSRWSTLAAQVSVALNHGLSLTPFWGSDIGGFYPTRELTGELYVRWFQFGAFCPSFRAHGRTWHLRRPWGWNTGDSGPNEHQGRGPDPSELHNAAVEPICRKYLELRYRLLPYNYTLCREAHDANLPLMRAMWLHYPDDAQAVARGDQYLWGRDMLVAPVVERGATERSVYLPKGDDWYDYWTGERHAGGQEVTRTVDLETLPLYVRAGAIVPLDPVRQYTAQEVEEPTELRVYAGRDGEFRWYEDDGESLQYQNRGFSWTRLAWSDGARRLTVAPDAAGPAAAARTLVVELIPGGEKKTVAYDGRRTEVVF